MNCLLDVRRLASLAVAALLLAAVPALGQDRPRDRYRSGDRSSSSAGFRDRTPARSASPADRTRDPRSRLADRPTFQRTSPARPEAARARAIRDIEENRRSTARDVTRSTDSIRRSALRELDSRRSEYRSPRTTYREPSRRDIQDYDARAARSLRDDRRERYDRRSVDRYNYRYGNYGYRNRSLFRDSNIRLRVTPSYGYRGYDDYYSYRSYGRPLYRGRYYGYGGGYDLGYGYGGGYGYDYGSYGSRYYDVGPRVYRSRPLSRSYGYFGTSYARPYYRAYDPFYCPTPTSFFGFGLSFGF